MTEIKRKFKTYYDENILSLKLEQFILFEIALMMVVYFRKDADPNKGYILFTKYHNIGKKLDVHDKMSISNYGAELSEQLNRSTKELMHRGASAKLGDETQSIMKDIRSKLMAIDLDEIKRPNWFVRTIRQIPLLHKVFQP